MEHHVVFIGGPALCCMWCKILKQLLL